MSIAKTLTLSLAAAIIFAAHPNPSFAATYQLNEVYVSSVSSSSSSSQDDDDDGGSIWDYILSWFS
jgi:hypothetical protein